MSRGVRGTGGSVARLLSAATNRHCLTSVRHPSIDGATHVTSTTSMPSLPIPLSFHTSHTLPFSTRRHLHVSAALNTDDGASSSSSSSSSASVISSSSSSHGGTGIVMLNMGGPARVSDVGPFLDRLFLDGDIVSLGALQRWLGPLMSRRRTPHIEKQYEKIGGSPIRKWTEIQGKEMCQRLDKLSPQTAPHKFYVCFRYSDPSTEEALTSLRADGIRRAIAFSQYPQFSCTTTGSSLNELWRATKRMGMESEVKWSVIDRWYEHPTFIRAVAKRIEMGLQLFPESDRSKVILLFSAHSLPHRTVNKGDPYPQEVGATVAAVMRQLNHSQRYLLAWQSQVGALPWLGPQTGEAIKGLAAQGHKHILTVPIAFTSDHIETLYEIDIEYAHVAKSAGVTHFHRSPSLNDEPLLADAMAEIVHQHLEQSQLCSHQYPFTCHACTNPICRSIVNPIQPYDKLRDQLKPDSKLVTDNPVRGM